MTVAQVAEVSADTIRRACPLCDADDHRDLLSRPPWRLVACRRCGLAYLPEAPAEAAIETEYEWSDSFRRERRRRWLNTPLMRMWTFAAILLRPPREFRAMSRIARSAPPGRMLDVGCGDGRLVAEAVRRGYDALGVELSPAMAARARQRAGPERILVGRLEECEVPPGSFDLVVSVSYMEHELNPRDALRRIFTLLRPGGVTMHKTPNYDSFLRRLRGAGWSGYRWPEHVQYFTPATLGRLLAECGFENVTHHANPFGDNFWITSRRPER